MDKGFNYGKSKYSKTIVFVLVIVIAVIWYVVRLQNTAPVASSPDAGSCQIHMIDVGQGDAFLVTCGKSSVLIDAGPRGGRDEIRDYLSAQNITTLDLVVFTHPHEDHIGGGLAVFEGRTVKKVMMPDATSNTSVFLELLEAIDSSGAEVIVPDDGDVFNVGDLKFTVLSPIGDDYGDLNNYSIVLRMDYGDVSALFTGDAEVKNEKEMIEKYPDLLKCDVLKVAHHGSDSSSSVEFLYAVKPKLALISCADGSQYGHPHDDTISKLEGIDSTIRRTDLDGNVVVASDGEKIWLYE